MRLRNTGSYIYCGDCAAQVADLPEVVTEAKRGAVDEVETFFLCFGLVHDLKLDITLEVYCAHFFGEAIKC